MNLSSNMTRTKKFIVNGMMMTAVSIGVRFVSVSFNVYLSNKVGAAALGLFTLISTVYGFALTLATSGINFATTKLVAEAMGDKEEGFGITSVMRKCFGYSLFFSGVAAIVLFIFSQFIGERILDDPRTVLSLRLLSFSLVPISVSSVLNGYFTAVRKVSRNALVQCFNQGIRIFLCILLLNILLTDDLESGCIAIVLSGVISELISFAVHGILYLLEKQKKKENAYKSKGGVGKKLYSIALPIAFSAYVRSALITIEHILIPKGLERNGESKDTSLASYGTLHSMVFPLVLFPSAITSSFAGLLIPEVAESLAASDTNRIDRIIKKVFRAVLAFSICIAGMMMCFGEEIGKNIYPSAENAGKYIIIIAPLIPIMYIDTSVDSILKGLGEQMYCMIVNIVDSALSVILVVILLPKFGIMGYVVTVYFTEIVNATLSITRLLVVTNVKTDIFSWIVKPVAAVLISTSISRWFFASIGNYATDKLIMSYHLVFTIALYVLTLMIFFVFSKEKRQQKKSQN